MELKLDLKERITIMYTLPEENDALGWKMVNQIRKKLAVSEKERNETEFVIVEKKVSWNKKGNEPKLFVFDDDESEFLNDWLVDLSENLRMNAVHFCIFEKVICEE